ncbi:MAG: LysR family transcriptional regulator [Woeseia sp.]
MNVADVQVFTKVAATRSFSEAATLLGVTRSTVSKSISRLEADLGVVLLNRTPRNVSLTDAGRTFFQHSLEVDESLERAIASVIGADQRPSGNVSCSLPTSLGATLIAPLMRKFRQAWPEVSLSLQFDDRYVDLIGSNIDVAIRVAQKLDDSSLLSRRIGSTREILVASPAYLARHGNPQDIQDLKSHRCLAVGNSSKKRATWRLNGADGPTEITVDCRTTSNSVLALILAACMDDGIISVPELFVSGELAQGLLSKVLPDSSDSRSYGVYAVYPNLKPPAKIRALIDFIESELMSINTMDRWSLLPQDTYGRDSTTIRHKSAG